MRFNITIIIVIMIILTSCVSTKDYKADMMQINNQHTEYIQNTNEQIAGLKVRITELENESKEIKKAISNLYGDLVKTSTETEAFTISAIVKMNEDMTDFKDSNDTDLRNILQENVDQAIEARNIIELLESEGTKRLTAIREMEIAAETDRTAIAENRRESEVDNVVNDFNLLREEWLRLAQRISDDADLAQKSAELAQNQVSVSMESAREAQNHARIVEQWIPTLRDFSTRLINMERKLRTAEQNIHTVRNNLSKAASADWVKDLTDDIEDIAGDLYRLDNTYDFSNLIYSQKRLEERIINIENRL